METIWLAFLTGLTTGGISCLAVQGGLLTSSLTSQVDQNQISSTTIQRWRHVTIFLVAKLIAYTIIGLLLGQLGSSLTVSPKLLGSFQIIVGFFMLATAARLLNIHPIFRYAVIQPPTWVYRMMKYKSRDSSMVTPAILGLLTVLMPCGVTQATMAIAIASGNALTGAAIMGAFVLGTSPVFFALGASVTELLQRASFTMVAASIVGLLGIVSINGGLGLRGSAFTIQNFYTAATTDISTLQNSQSTPTVNAEGFQEVNIKVAEYGYTASSNTLRVGVPVRITLSTDRIRGCARAFTVPDYGISKVLPETGEDVIEFTPKKVGRLAYSCSMGMYTGSFNIIN